jgi:LysM repeat protein
MSDRGTPGVDGPPACPFIAFDDERDERSSSPDHRHRCFAEVEPAPRALAHQEAYCLSSAFPVCPTFQDWARREAAQARSSGRAAKLPPVAATAVDADEDRPEPAAPIYETPAPPEPAPADIDDDDLWSAPVHDDEIPARRNPPRDWAAPPPWATGGPAGSSSTASGRSSSGSGDRPPEFLASRSASAGLAGSAADRLASGQPVSPSPSAPASDELAGLVAPAAAGAASAGAAPPLTRPPSGAYPTTTASGRRPSVSSTRPRNRTADHEGPSWESAKRYEAYPTIKTRAGLPGIPRIMIWVAALGIAALALFFLPDLLSFGGGGASPTASPTTSARATVEPTATPIPEPTPQTYTIKKGDILNKIAKKFGVTVDQILEANKDTIKNANKIKVGQEIIIPVPIPEEFTDPGAAEPSASDEATPEP